MERDFLTEEQREARQDLLRTITDNGPLPRYGIRVEAPMSLADDAGADHLDALEGWIADPTINSDK